MFSLQLSAEQLAIRDTVRAFVAQKIKPVALASSRLEPRAKPLLTDLLDEASQLGLRTLALSEDAGGAGADTLTGCIVIEELAAGDPDIAAVLARTAMLAPALFDRAMTQEHRDRFLPEFLSDDRYHLALANHEAERDGTLGIDYHRPERRTAAAQTTATRSGDAFVVNGRKIRVANAPLAKLFAVEVADGANAAAMLLIPRDTPGLAVKDNDEPGRPYHGARGEVIFENCRVPAANRPGQVLPDDGNSPLDQALNLGIGHAAYEAALDYAGLRVQGGRRIIEHQAIGTKLAEIAIRLDVARAAIWRAAWAIDHPEAVADGSLPNLPLANAAKVFSSEAIYHATKDAAECFGAMGVMRDMPLQKYVHDALVCLHSGMSNSDAKLRIAEILADYSRPSALAAAE
jgi:alkylation response protein AidB-like acyl-CoA dehydrogenase